MTTNNMNTKSDPNRVVTTVFGKSAKRRECRFIKGNFYKMNEECFKFEGRWYRINSGFLVEDITTGKHILKDGVDILYGIAVGKEGKVVTGHFIKDLFKNIPVISSAIPHNILDNASLEGNTVYAYDMETVKQLGLVEDIPTGVFMTKDKASRKIAIKGTYNFPIDYSFENSGSSIKDAYRHYKTLLVPKAINANLLKELSFGWEFETTDGFIHPRHLMKTSLIPLRDGSISGYEFVTCPLQGKKGLDTTLSAAAVMGKYTTNNITCALHLHIGNIPTSEQFITSFYKVCNSIQNDIFSMFPKAMARTSKYKDRDYCNKLPGLGINPSIKRIVGWASGREDFYDNSFRGIGMRSHPDDQGNNRKWVISQRYCWVNIIPYLFSKRNTVEFRIHTPSANPAKLINWLFICAGIVNFVKNNAKMYTNESISKLTLKQIIKVVYGEDTEIVAHLISYIDWRRNFMKQCADSGDDIGSTEIMGDLAFKFPYNGMKTLVGNG